jgi:hypothetical protein
MDQPAAPQQNLKKPIGGFIVVLVAAVLIGGWLYVDGVKNDLETKVDSLESRLEAERMKDAQQAETKQEPAPAAEEVKWQTYSAELDGQRFQIDLPAGTKLTSEAGTFAYVMVDPPSESESLPLMAIRVVAASEGEFDGTFGTTVKAGDRNFWLYLWEGLEWEHFERVSASFKPLE